MSLALRFGASGEAERFEPPPLVALRPTGWRIAREMRSDNPGEATARTLEDTPFYARSVIRDATLRRNSQPACMRACRSTGSQAEWVQWMLPFRMPRRRNWAD